MLSAQKLFRSFWSLPFLLFGCLGRKLLRHMHHFLMFLVFGTSRLLKRSNQSLLLTFDAGLMDPRVLICCTGFHISFFPFNIRIFSLSETYLIMIFYDLIGFIKSLSFLLDLLKMSFVKCGFFINISKFFIQNLYILKLVSIWIQKF